MLTANAALQISISLILLGYFQVAYGLNGSECINGSLYKTFEVTEGKPKVELEIKSTTTPIHVDSRVDLNCKVKANPAAQILWFYEGDLTTTIDHQREYRYSTCNLTLTMFLAVPIDTGRYTCQARNSHGEDSSTVVVEVKQRSQLFYKKALIEKTPPSGLRPGQNVTLSCKHNASKGICSWHKNNQIIELKADDEMSCDSRRCCLSIVNFSKEDQGVYECYMYHDVRRATLNVTLDEYEPCCDEQDNNKHAVTQLSKFNGTQPNGAERLTTALSEFWHYGVTAVWSLVMVLAL